MMQILVFGLAAGAASALLFAAITSGVIAALVLFYLAPLPILIAAIGWSHWAGLVAALSAAIGLGAAFGFSLFLAFLVGVGLPAWWLGYLALLARPVANNTASRLEWYPAGRLLLWSAIVGALLVLLAVPTLGTDKESFQAGLRAAVGPPMRALAVAKRLPPGVDIDQLIDFIVGAIPATSAVLSTLLNAFNLWLAGRIVLISGRLRRPWPDLPTLSLPSYAPTLLAVAIVGMFLPDLMGVLCVVLTACLFMIYAIMGFAVLHAITRGVAGRPFMLAFAYASVPLLGGWPIPLMSMLGLAESAFNIRARFGARSGPTGGPSAGPPGRPGSGPPSIH